MEPETAWEQKFVQYEKCLVRLREALAWNNTADAYTEACIMRFVYTYEQAWKTLQAYLSAQGYNGITGPKPVLTQALADGLISDATGWTELMKGRNSVTHDYNQEKANVLFRYLKEHFIYLLEELYQNLKTKRGTL